MTTAMVPIASSATPADSARFDETTANSIARDAAVIDVEPGPVGRARGAWTRARAAGDRAHLNHAAGPHPSVAAARADRWTWSRRLIAIGAFFVTYQDLRPFSILFTYSDFFFLFGGLLLVFGRGVPARPFGSLTHYWYLLFAVFITFMMASSLLNGSPTRFLVVAAQYSFAFIMLPLILYSDTSTRWRSVVFFLVLGVLAMEVFAIAVINYYDFSHVEIAKQFGRYFYSGNGRVSGFVGNPNVHAAIICMTLPFVYYLRVRKWISIPMFTAAFGVLVTAMMFAASATGVATSLIVTAVFVMVARLKPSPSIIAIVALFFTGWVILGSPMPRAFEKRVAPAFATGNIEQAGTFEARLELVREAWRYADDTTLVGIGVDQFRVIGDQGLPVHNTFLLVWTESGFIALLAWIGLQILLVAGPFRILSSRPQEAALGLSVMTAFLIFSMSSTVMYSRIWITFAVLAIAPSVAIQSQIAVRRARRPGYRRTSPPDPYAPIDVDWSDITPPKEQTR